MRGLYRGPILAVALVPSLLCAAPPVEVPGEVTGEVGAFVAIRAKTDGKAVRFVPLDAGLNVFPADLLSDKKSTVVSSARPGRYRLLAYSSVKDDPTEPAVVVVVIGGAPAPPPKPVDPEPKPKPPAPDALKSFRVILVSESGAALTTAQFGVMYGKAVSDWLDANTTGKEWRRRDKDAATDGDTAAINDVWNKGKPKVASVPCVVVERNGVVQVVPFEATPEAMVTKLNSIRGK